MKTTGNFDSVRRRDKIKYSKIQYSKLLLTSINKEQLVELATKKIHKQEHAIFINILHKKKISKIHGCELARISMKNYKLVVSTT